MSAHRGLDLTNAIATLIESGGWVVGRSVRPDPDVVPNGWQGTTSFIPYVVVHPTPGGVFFGTLGDPFADAQPDYIISSYGAVEQQAQQVNDAVFSLMTSNQLTVPGRFVQLVIPDVEGGVVRDDDVSPPIFYSPTRWRIFTTPA